jgi:hypothetical protein
MGLIQIIKFITICMAIITNQVILLKVITESMFLKLLFLAYFDCVIILLARVAYLCSVQEVPHLLSLFGRLFIPNKQGQNTLHLIHFLNSLLFLFRA